MLKARAQSQKFRNTQKKLNLVNIMPRLKKWRKRMTTLEMMNEAKEKYGIKIVED